jgi:plasmid stability protein
MSQVLVRNLDPGVVERLRDRANTSGRSLEAVLRCILNDEEVEGRVSDPLGEARRIREIFKGREFSDSTDLLREDRER